MQPPEPGIQKPLKKTEELLSTPNAAEILLHLLKSGPCSEQELKDEECDDKSPEEALDFLTGKGLIESEGASVRLTPKGRKAAEVMGELEGLYERPAGIGTGTAPGSPWRASGRAVEDLEQEFT